MRGLRFTWMHTRCDKNMLFVNFFIFFTFRFNLLDFVFRLVQSCHVLINFIILYFNKIFSSVFIMHCFFFFLSFDFLDFFRLYFCLQVLKPLKLIYLLVLVNILLLDVICNRQTVDRYLAH